MQLIDGHVHCGRQDRSAPQAYEEIAPTFDAAGVSAAVCFPPVMEIYDRHNRNFVDDEHWRQRRRDAGAYLRGLRGRRHRIYPFLFVWNDFDTSLLDEYCGIKWHRHPDEPEYHYDDPACARMLAAIRERGLVVLIEEEYRCTMRFADELARGMPIIIPHIGALNGGVQRLLREDFWRRENTYADMSGGVSAADARAFLDRYGPHRLIFGSDYPFGRSATSLATLRELKLPEADERLICGENILRLLKNREKYENV